MSPTLRERRPLREVARRGWCPTNRAIRPLDKSAQRDPAIARQLVVFFSVDGQRRPAYERAQQLLLDAGVPACGTHETDGALRSR
jgi:hypothetical protein